MAERNRKQSLRGALLCVGACALLLSAPTLKAAAEDRGPLACTYSAPVGEGYAGVAAHTHTADCYNAAGELVCPLPEIPAHVHTDGCYTEQRRLVCPLEETPGHQHSESCYADVRGELRCTDKSEEHAHTDACYAWTRELSCGLEEGAGAHIHEESCYVSDRVLSCGQLGLHVHNAACRDASGALICGLPQFEEHVHGPECFAAPEQPEPEEPAAPEQAEEPEKPEEPNRWKGDPTADVESRADWEEMFRELDSSGPWNETLLAVAQSQLGYRESSRNYALDSEGILGGYTRYGAWYGRAYSPWCAMFVSFCLHYAQIPEEAMPIECSVRRWIEELEPRGLYVPAAGYTPRPGDLIFFDEEGDGLADHVGLVESVSEDEAGVWRLVTIEGNRSTAVERFTYRLTNPTVMGFCPVPDKPEEPTAATEEPEPDSAEPTEEPVGPEPLEEAAEPEPAKLSRKTPLPPKQPEADKGAAENFTPGWKKNPKH